MDEQLTAYSKKEIYPFHMPGHKRVDQALLNPYSLDITEIDGFDNLHNPMEILLEAKIRLAKLYGARESYFLVNGSTCGILAAISAAAGRGDTLLMGRNCHKAVYHGAALGGLHTEYLYPVITKDGIQGSISCEEVEQKLKDHPGIRAVILTSPTYDGVLSDIRRIADSVHKYDIPLIVDEAHGAHLGFGGGFPESAVSEGADVVIQSFHKTLPSLTQTAVLHRTSERISPERLQKYLGIYQTSSPSYLLMASIDRCVRLLEEGGEEYFISFQQRLGHFYDAVENLKNLKVLTEKDFTKREAYQVDISKILIDTSHTALTGMELMDRLRRDHRLELEMASRYYALAMTSIMDTDEGFERLAKALEALDQQIENQEDYKKDGGREEPCRFIKELYGMKEVVLPVWEAEEMEREQIPLEKAEGRIAAGTVSLYPPGIPVVVPGERLEKDVLKRILECRRKGLQVCGLSSDLRIEVLTEQHNFEKVRCKF